MINFYRDSFDSDIFNTDVYKLYLDKKIESENVITNLIKNKNNSYVHCFTTFENSNIDILNKLGFRLISIRSTYKLALKNDFSKVNIPIGFKVFKNSEKHIKLADKEILSIAKLIGGTSRYFKDNNLPREKSISLYVTWIKNSLYQRYVDETFVVLNNKDLVGINSIKIKPEGGYIDLIGIKEKFQNKGLGQVLLQKGVEYLLDKNIKNMYTVTEGENIIANRFYQKNGFLLEGIQLVYHKKIT